MNSGRGNTLGSNRKLFKNIAEERRYQPSSIIRYLGSASGRFVWL